MPVVCVWSYAVMVSVRSNQRASESGETGEKGWLWGVGGGPAGVGIADGSGGGSMIRASAWEAEGRGRRSHSDPARGTRRAARQRRPLPCWIVYARRGFVRRIRRVSAASLHSSRAPFWENLPRPAFFDFGHDTVGQRQYKKEKYENDAIERILLPETTRRRPKVWCGKFR